MLFDLIVIGSGPGGTAAALEGARAGKKVALVEERPRLGGDCVHQSTVPSKALRESVLESAAKTKLMSKLLHRRDRVVLEESDAIHAELKRAGVALYQGRAKLTTIHDVEISSRKGKERVTASSIILAVGASPGAPKHLKVDGKRILDSNSILGLKAIPKSMVVLGGGIVGCEYASIFAQAGCRVTIVDRRHEILAAVDREIVNRLTEVFEEKGVEILLEADATSLKQERAGVKLKLSTGRTLSAEVVLVAQGRYGNTEGLGLKEAGVDCDQRGLIGVDSHFRTSVAHIYAVGDVVGPPAYASTSVEEGRIAARHALRLSGGPLPVLFPYVIFTIPEISMVGQTEDDLLAAKVDFEVGRAEFSQLVRGRLKGGASRGLLKLLVERRSRKVLGVHIIGDGASELIHIGQAVMSLGGDAHYLANAVFNYPSLSEAYKTAALQAIRLIESA